MVAELLKQARKELNCVSLGPAGEYFVQARDGRTWLGGMTDKKFKTADK